MCPFIIFTAASRHLRVIGDPEGGEHQLLGGLSPWMATDHMKAARGDRPARSDREDYVLEAQQS